MTKMMQKIEYWVNTMSMELIRQKYNVPAKRGIEVEVENNMKGKIVGSYGLYLRIKIFDPDIGWQKYIGSYHPTWKIKYPVVA